MGVCKKYLTNLFRRWHEDGEKGQQYLLSAWAGVFGMKGMGLLHRLEVVLS